MLPPSSLLVEPSIVTSVPGEPLCGDTWTLATGFALTTTDTGVDVDVSKPSFAANVRTTVPDTGATNVGVRTVAFGCNCTTGPDTCFHSYVIGSFSWSDAAPVSVTVCPPSGARSDAFAVTTGLPFV